MQRFVRGMKTMLPLRHTNLVALYGAGRTGALCWMAMEYIDGRNLMQVIKRRGGSGVLDWRETLHLTLQVARALEFAHGHQIVHRNVTPSNILVSNAEPLAKLGDLMLAKALEGTLAKQVTLPGELVGNLHYMSPEQTRGGALDYRSDLYNLGATAYVMLTGVPPFGGSTHMEIITKVRQGQPERPNKFQLYVPLRFEEAVLTLLAKRPEDRFQTATELIAELEGLAQARG
jgi:serine/threonine-protein kinase